MKKKTTLDKLGRPHGGGLPKAKIDLAELEKLCMMQCTHDEIAAWFGVASRTIDRKRTEPAVAEIMDRGYAKGRISIRRAQMKAAEAGDRTMLIWLGKQLLGQRDHHELSGPNGGPIEVKEIKVTFVAPAVSE